MKKKCTYIVHVPANWTIDRIADIISVENCCNQCIRTTLTQDILMCTVLYKPSLFFPRPLTVILHETLYMYTFVCGLADFNIACNRYNYPMRVCICVIVWCLISVWLSCTRFICIAINHFIQEAPFSIGIYTFLSIDNCSRSDFHLCVHVLFNKVNTCTRTIIINWPISV